MSQTTDDDTTDDEQGYALWMDPDEYERLTTYDNGEVNFEVTAAQATRLIAKLTKCGRDNTPIAHPGGYPIGTAIVDCGERGEVVAVHDDHDQTVYDIEYEDGGTDELTGRELELGLEDGTIEVDV